jgi:hypothetical protein
VAAIGYGIALLDRAVPRDPQGLALDDQLMPDAQRLVAEPVPGLDLGREWQDIPRPVPVSQERVQASV